MDLTSTKLVVLSSCLSGMNEVFLSTGFHGMVSAFSAAGVKYVISSLWSVNDLATAVFMDAFYSYYANGAEEPPTALRKAQDYLRDATIEELRMQGWFEVIRISFWMRKVRNLWNHWKKKRQMETFSKRSILGRICLLSMSLN